MRVLLTPLSPPRTWRRRERRRSPVELRLASLVKMQLFNTARAPDPTRRLHHRVLFQLSMYGDLSPRWPDYDRASSTSRPRAASTFIRTRCICSSLACWVGALFCIFGHFLDFYRNAGRMRRACIRGALRSPHVWGLSEARSEIRPGGVVVVPNDAELRAQPGRSRSLRHPLDSSRAVIGTAIAKWMNRRLGPDRGTAEVRRRHPELLLVLAGPSCAQEDFRPARRAAGWLTVGVVGRREADTVSQCRSVVLLPGKHAQLIARGDGSGLLVATRVGAIPEMITWREWPLIARQPAELAEGMVRRCRTACSVARAADRSRSLHARGSKVRICTPDWRTAWPSRRDPGKQSELLRIMAHSRAGCPVAREVGPTGPTSVACDRSSPDDSHISRRARGDLIQCWTALHHRQHLRPAERLVGWWISSISTACWRRPSAGPRCFADDGCMHEVACPIRADWASRRSSVHPPVSIGRTIWSLEIDL
jgi:hypothetical protein